MTKTLFFVLISSVIMLQSDPLMAQSDTALVKTLLKKYYAAIEKHDYATAFTFWNGNGEGSPSSFSVFQKGFRQTAHTSINILQPSRFEPAAGSLYATVPVRVTAELMSGKQQRFAGTYVLRRVNGPAGATNAWHLYSAHLKSVSQR